MTVALPSPGNATEVRQALLRLELDLHAAGAKRQPGTLLRAVQAKDDALLVLHDRVVLALDDGGSDFGGQGFAGDGELSHEDAINLSGGGGSKPKELYACVLGGARVVGRAS